MTELVRPLEKVKDGNRIYYGGKQQWCSKKLLRDSGCGVIGCAQILFHIDGRNRYSIHRKEFMELVELLGKKYLFTALISPYIGWTLGTLLGAVAGQILPSVIVSATACGLVLGFYYLRFRSLLMVIILHAMNNLTACFLRAIDMEDVTLRSAVDNDIAYWGIYSVCLIVSIVSFIRMARVMARTKSDKTTNNM